MRLHTPVVTLVLCLLGGGVAQDRPALEKLLKTQLQGKSVVVRGFYDANELQYDQTGQIKGVVNTAPWTLLGYVHINRVHLEKERLQVEGERVFIRFDGSPDKRKAQEINSGSGVTIYVDSPDGAPDNALLAALQKVLLGATEQLTDVVPAYWQSYLRGTTPNVPKETFQGAEVKKVGGSVHAPRVLFDPDPAYNAVARAMRFEGRLVLSGVVDIDGWMKQIQIASPVGFGLDERGIAAAQTWRFDPATKDGKPVPVRISIEINFHLF